jgi:hypothetical protein
LQLLWSRLLFPLALSIGIIALIEAIVFVQFKPSLLERSGWLLHDPYKGEPFDRVEVREKLRNLEDSEPDIISVGDSSGFFSIQPTIVNRYLHGFKYVNFSTGANHAYNGYLAMAEYMLQRSHHVKYVVLYLFPMLLPADAVMAQGDLGTILYNDLIAPQSYAAPPSAALSPFAKAAFFDHRVFHPDEPLTNHAGALEFVSIARQTLGWLPEFDIRFPRIHEKVPSYPPERGAWYYNLGLTETSAIKATLRDFKSMVNRYHAQLVVAFAPFPRSALIPYDPNVARSEEDLVAFQKENPDVKFLFPLLTTFSSEKFGMYNHISREYTFLSSERLGKALARLIEDPNSIPLLQAHYHGAEQMPEVTYVETGEPDPQALKAALALYLYANTADEAYWGTMSKRARNALGRSESFKYMMDDARARNADLRSRGIDIGLDTSGLIAKRVTVRGMTHCSGGAGAEWYKISGVMNFTYSSRTSISREPVGWPASSDILIPTLIEDGERRFDGYCEEPSLNEVHQ